MTVMTAIKCVCGHAKRHHSSDAECSGGWNSSAPRGCGCIEFRDERTHVACRWCGGEGFTRTEPGPCKACKGACYVRKERRGGARPGAGRKPRTAEPTQTRSVRWTAAELDSLAALTDVLGEDSDAETIRAAVAELAAKHGIGWPH